MKRLSFLAIMMALIALVVSPSAAVLAQDGGNPLCNGLGPEDCQLLSASAVSMAGTSSFSLPSWSLSLIVTAEGQTTTVNASGSGHVMLSDDPSQLLIHLVIDQAAATSPEGDQSFTGEILIRDQMVFVLSDGQWYGQEMTEEDLSQLQGLTDMSSLTQMGDLSGMEGLDLGTLITTARGSDTTVGDQTVATFITNIDVTGFLVALLSSPALGAVLGQAEMGMEGMTPEQMAGFAMMLSPMFEGSTIAFTQGVGVDDNLLHSFGVDVVFNVDTTAFDPSAQPVNFELHLATELAEHNQTFDVPAPTEFRPMEELNAQFDMGLGGLGM